MIEVLFQGLDQVIMTRPSFAVIFLIGMFLALGLLWRQTAKHARECEVAQAMVGDELRKLRTDLTTGLEKIRVQQQAQDEMLTVHMAESARRWEHQEQLWEQARHDGSENRRRLYEQIGQLERMTSRLDERTRQVDGK